jgi:hypothetical protein
VVRQALDLLNYPLGRQRLDGLDKPRVQSASLRLEETAVGHLLCQSMFEGIDQLGKQARLIQELGVLRVATGGQRPEVFLYVYDTFARRV